VKSRDEGGALCAVLLRKWGIVAEERWAARDWRGIGVGLVKLLERLQRFDARVRGFLVTVSAGEDPLAFGRFDGKGSGGSRRGEVRRVGVLPRFGRVVWLGGGTDGMMVG
jgi:hypothetical protein